MSFSRECIMTFFNKNDLNKRNNVATLIVELRSAVSNCSTAVDPLSDVRRAGFLESGWHQHISEMILDELGVNYEPAFLDRNFCVEQTLQRYRARLAVKSLLTDLCRLLLRNLSNVVANASSSKLMLVLLERNKLSVVQCLLNDSSTDMTLTAYRYCIMSILSSISKFPDIIELRPSNRPFFEKTWDEHQEKQIAKATEYNDKLELVDLHRQRFFTLFLLVSEETEKSIVAMPSVVVENLLKRPEFRGTFDLASVISTCRSDKRTRQLTFQLAISLTNQMIERIKASNEINGISSRFYNTLRILMALLMFSPENIENNTPLKLCLDDAELFCGDHTALRPAATILLNLNPFALTFSSFSWACKMVLLHWNKTEIKRSTISLDLLLLTSINWLHAALIMLLTAQCSNAELCNVVSFVTTVFAFYKASEVSCLMAEEQQQRKQSFDGALSNLINQLRQLLSSTNGESPNTITANRIIAPFRQFSSRCNLVAKVTCVLPSTEEATSSTSTILLHPLSQCLLCMFVILCPATYSLCPGILDSLLANELPKSRQRLCAIFQAAHIFKTARNGGAKEFLLSLKVTDRLTGVAIFLRKLSNHYLGEYYSKNMTWIDSQIDLLTY